MEEGNVSPSIDALAVALLTAEGRTQVQIAAELNLSQAAVSRLFKAVKENYIVTTLNRNLVDEETLQQVRRRISQRKIVEQLQLFAERHEIPSPVVHVIPMQDSPNLSVRFDEFASQAAVIVRELLSSVRERVGVAWGSTIWHTTQALRTTSPAAWREKIPIEFIPLCGDSLVDSERSYADRTSSRIVSDLSKIVNGEKVRPHWLGLVPAFIPRTFKDREIRTINRLIDLVPQYGRIFGLRIPKGPWQPPLAQDLHMILTAAGPAERPVRFGGNPLLGLNQEEAHILAENIHGDIGGVLLPKLKPASKSDTVVKSHPLVQDLTRRWTGLKMEHLRACAQLSFSEGGRSRPGVTLLCFGADHASIVLEAVRQSLVNHLIIGSDLEAALSSILAEMTAPSG